MACPLRALARLGHCPQIELPEQVWAAISPFLVGYTT